MKPEESEDNSNKFEFLGMQFNQVVLRSKYKKHKVRKPLDSVGSLQKISGQTLGQVLKSSTTPKQIVIRLNPIIRVRVNYARYSNARTSGQVGK